MKKIAIFEPYYGGSHKAFIQSLCDQLPIDFQLFSMPARKWKWRMRMAAPCYINKINTNHIDLTETDAIFCSSFLDVAAFKGLLPNRLKKIPVYTYFHENQFAYPVQVNDQRDFHFSLTNLTTALATDHIAFNSYYNLNSFLQGCEDLLKYNYDMELGDYQSIINQKAIVLSPGLLFDDIDSSKESKESNGGVLTILWNHRWEHDKNPKLFFETLFKLKKKQIPFKLIVVGESFSRVPKIFKEAKEILSDNLIQFGYAPSRTQYIKMLKKSDIVVSTANHEFFGISVLEAVRAGCFPLLPNRLSYPELFDKSFLYEDNDLYDRLATLLSGGDLPSINGKYITQRFDWSNLKHSYVKWFE